ncbi:MAG: hypothetical protein B7Y39_13335 [Bdellovibrio sp. 28-41-41]|nr:MAG: hypothetical protein B7Y39_13335 [Bdellovibrio sp. 28-41-41]
MEEIQKTVSYLKSRESLIALSQDPYWPKWNGPWLHMLTLHEMGASDLIPKEIIPTFIDSLNRLPLKIFPIQPVDYPPGLDPYRGSACHCQIGTVYQVLSKCGVDVDTQLPWMRSWILNYQMPDGGYSCDNNAYLVKDEIPSSMVGLISVFEALLICTPRSWTKDEKAVLDKGAAFLIERKLINGSTTEYNKSERESAKKWADLCFPRFYHYDILRGLNAITLWAEKTGSHLPESAIKEAKTLIADQAVNGQLKQRRRIYENANTFFVDENNEWSKQRRPAAIFPLVESVNQPNQYSPYLSQQWRQVQDRLARIKLT